MRREEIMAMVNVFMMGSSILGDASLMSRWSIEVVSLYCCFALCRCWAMSGVVRSSYS